MTEQLGKWWCHQRGGEDVGGQRVRVRGLVLDTSSGPLLASQVEILTMQ